MKTWVKVLLIASASIIALWIVGRLTKVFEFNHAVTNANAPTIKKGQLFFSSILVKPSRFNFICFRIVRPEFGPTPQINFYRLCGMPGDVIEIRNGNLYVNDSAADDSLKLEHLYTIARADFETIKEEVSFEEDFISDVGNDSLQTFIEDDLIKQRNINAHRMILSKNEGQPDLNEAFPRYWNQDQFGPVQIPAHKYFVLGDSRHNASDSRCVGFIDESDFAGTILCKK